VEQRTSWRHLHGIGGFITAGLSGVNRYKTEFLNQLSRPPLNMQLHILPTLSLHHGPLNNPQHACMPCPYVSDLQIMGASKSIVAEQQVIATRTISHSYSPKSN
jgi:hypothetical protein